MDANIKTAASYLRRAAYNMQRQIDGIRGNESHERQQQMQDDIRLADRIRQTELDMALKAAQTDQQDRGKNEYEIMRLAHEKRELHKQRDQLKQHLDQLVADDTRRIHALEAQIEELNKIANRLEWWSG